ncbi:MAG TPA: c-type cytochrome [Blastocatellia bacterium]
MIEKTCAKWITIFVVGTTLGVINAVGPAYSDAGVPLQSADNSTKTAEQVYKNIQVLTGLPASQLDGVMYFMSASLGVACSYCHTNPWDSDEKTSKLTTRRMIQMMRTINKENFSGNNVVNCYTCHRGQTQTATSPPANPLSLQPDAGTTVSKPTTPLPSSDEIIERYIREIGGQVAINNIKTRVSRGTETTTDGATAVTVQIETYQTAENKLLITRKDQRGEAVVAFNGATGWIKDGGGQREMNAKELDAAHKDADFFRFLKIKTTYPQTRTLGREKLGDREAYIVGATSTDGSREKLYFDTRTGLLLRKYVAFNTAFGTIPEITDFDDYREVSGVKLPFTIIWSRSPFSSARKFAEVKVNIKFEMPK